MIFSTYESPASGGSVLLMTHRTLESARRSLRRWRNHPVYRHNLRLWTVDDLGVEMPEPGDAVDLGLLDGAREIGYP